MSRKRKPFIVANWKMNKSQKETATYIEAFVKSFKDIKHPLEVGLAPVFTSLSVAEQLLKGSNVRLCAQNVHWDDNGQYTGEISAPMLKELGVTHAIVGHSERRKFFGETNETVNKRLKACIKHGLGVILCVGETKQERETGNTKAVVKDHIINGLYGIAKEDFLRYVSIAYEPVWAIGTGLNATVEQAVEVHSFIRELINEVFGNGACDELRILYGGSVKPDNIDGFMSSEQIDGALVGGASLEPESFLRICNFKEGL